MTAAEAPDIRAPQRRVLAAGAAALLSPAAAAGAEGGGCLAAAAGIGGLAGVGLYHASFGFTAAWRRMTRERRGAGLRAQMLLTAAAGGLLMGYRAQLAYGCKIGAYLGGMVSGSLHGMWWLVWGFAGSILGAHLRARLAMDPPLHGRAAAPTAS